MDDMGSQRLVEIFVDNTEAQTYRALYTHSVCKEQIDPHFYGLFETFDPSFLGYNLASFKKDKTAPNAILFEYLPHAKSLENTAGTISSKLKDRAIEGLQKIHDADVIHSDTRPKDVLVIPQNTSQRVVWVDFDVSIVFPTEGTRFLLSLNKEEEWELSVFQSRVRKLRGST